VSRMTTGAEEHLKPPLVFRCSPGFRATVGSMSLLDLVVVLAAAVAAWTGWQSGGLHTVVGVACRLAGLVLGVGVADWVARVAWGFPARVVTEIVVILVGWMLGGRLGAWLRPDRHPADRVAVPDRVLGVGYGRG
jgi:hypothetical protein